MAQKNIQLTEKAYNAFKELKGEYMSFTDLIFFLLKERKDLIQMSIKYEHCCEELEVLKASKSKSKKVV